MRSSLRGYARRIISLPWENGLGITREYLMAAIVQLTMSDIVKSIGTTDYLEAAAEYLETHGYTVTPPEGERA